jgi:calcineurin-like phosphoesterase family protein
MADTAPTFRNGVLSIYQSAIDDFARAKQDAPSVLAVRPGLEDPMVRAGLASAQARMPQGTAPVAESATISDKVRTCAELGLQYLEAGASGDPAKVAEIRSQLAFSECDAKWITTLDAYLKYFGAGGGLRPIPYVRAGSVGNQVIDMKPDARVALIGDWGTGSDGAVRLLQSVAQQKPDVVIHLGDVYYSGTAQECGAYFEQIIDKLLDRTNSKVPVYTLAGNHDMYSGGAGYYGLLARLNDPPLRQTASFFCLRATDASWQFLGMDTGLHDHDPFSVTTALTYLEPDEETWHAARLGEFPGRSILLSHHQLFSAFSEIGPRDANGKLSPCNPRLLTSFRRFQAAAPGRLAAWFWGHEHNLCIYKPYAGLDVGRCIGHGAIPVFASENPYDVPDDLPDPPQLIGGTQLASIEDVYAHGYVMLTLGKTGAKVDYFQETDFSKPFYSETIPAAVATG